MPNICSTLTTVWSVTSSTDSFGSTWHRCIVAIRQPAVQASATSTSSVTKCPEAIACLDEEATPVQTLHRVRVPDDLSALYYLQPPYDEPEFIVRSVWRQFAAGTTATSPTPTP